MRKDENFSIVIADVILMFDGQPSSLNETALIWAAASAAPATLPCGKSFIGQRVDAGQNQRLMHCKHNRN